MDLTKIFQTHERAAQLANNVTVGSGTSSFTSDFALSNQINKATLGYDINGGTGVPSVECQVSLGQDINGVDVWITVATSTNAKDVFTVDDEVDKVRLNITETSAGAGTDLTGINAWARGRTL